MNIKLLIEIVSFIFLIAILIASFFFLYRVFYIILGFSKDKPLKKSKVEKSFLILIPARNESHVINNLLDSIKSQTYNKDKVSVCVIVENNKDKSIDIAKSYGYNFFVRKNLENKGKGYALDECLQDILKSNKNYDLLSIIDADNIIAPNFLEEMNNASGLGYSMGKAYHRQLNKQGNLIADCSTFTFANVNTFQNKARTKLGRNIIASGTGIFIDFNIIKELSGWPFNTLAEDYEMSLYMALKNKKTIYIPSTYYYDEQPTNFSTLRKQRVRWIKGFSQARNKYFKDLVKSYVKNKDNRKSLLDLILGVIPNIVYIISIISYISFMLVLTIVLACMKNPLYLTSLMCVLICVFAIYIILAFYTFLQIIVERRYMKYSFINSLKIILFNPIFITLYIPNAIESCLKKNVDWKPIEHGKISLK